MNTFSFHDAFRTRYPIPAPRKLVSQKHAIERDGSGAAVYLYEVYSDGGQRRFYCESFTSVEDARDEFPRAELTF